MISVSWNIWQNPETSTPKMGRQNHRYTEGLPLKRARKRAQNHQYTGGYWTILIFGPLYTERSRRLFQDFPIIYMARSRLFKYPTTPGGIKTPKSSHKSENHVLLKLVAPYKKMEIYSLWRGYACFLVHSLYHLSHELLYSLPFAFSLTEVV